MFNSNATTINEQMSFYSTLSIVLMAIAIVLLVAAIVMWFIFKIPHSFRVLTGAGVEKEIRQLSSATKSGAGYIDNGKNKAVISWNTSTNLNTKTQDDETELLINNSQYTMNNLVDNEATMVLDQGAPLESNMAFDSQNFDPEATMVLDDLNFDPEATTVLDGNQKPDGFEIEEEIIITGNNIKRN